MVNKKENKEEVDKHIKTFNDDNRKINSIILQQAKVDAIKQDQAHYFIKKSGEIVTGLGIDETGKHCKDNDKESIGIILEGFHYSPAQQAALLNVIYTCNHKVGKELVIKGYDIYYPGRVNPNLNMRSLNNKYVQTYGKK